MNMLRVVACSNLIIDNWNGQKIDTRAEIKVIAEYDKNFAILSTAKEDKCMF